MPRAAGGTSRAFPPRGPVAATFGIWTGLTGLGAPLALGLTSFVLWRLQRADGWTMVWGMVGLLAFLLSSRAEAPLLGVWALNAALIGWKHRRDLRDPMCPRGVRMPKMR